MLELDVTILCSVVVISVTKEGVKFSTRGDIGTANIVLRQNTTVDKVCTCGMLVTSYGTSSIMGIVMCLA